MDTATSRLSERGIHARIACRCARPSLLARRRCPCRRLAGRPRRRRARRRSPPPTGTRSRGGQPLLSHAFLSRAARDRLRVAAHRLDAALPHRLARRARSSARCRCTRRRIRYGEYVFDWAWADAYRRHGRRYYPKLVAAIPFTPATGPRAARRRRRRAARAARRTRWRCVRRRTRSRRCTSCSPDADEAARVRSAAA